MLLHIYTCLSTAVACGFLMVVDLRLSENCSHNCLKNIKFASIAVDNVISMYIETQL